MSRGSRRNQLPHRPLSHADRPGGSGQRRRRSPQAPVRTRVLPGRQAPQYSEWRPSNSEKTKRDSNARKRSSSRQPSKCPRLEPQRRQNYLVSLPRLKLHAASAATPEILAHIKTNMATVVSPSGRRFSVPATLREKGFVVATFLRRS